MSRTICLYLHVHQPHRLRHYTVFDAGNNTPYWDDGQNKAILQKVASKSYRPTNEILLELLQRHPHFAVSLSITGTVLEQLRDWAPDVIESFKKLVATGRAEILAETYYHSLAFFYSVSEFKAQVQRHRDLVQELFGVTPTVLRNTEFAYNNQLARWADEEGYKGIITEGWEPVLGYRSPNYMYRPVGTKNIRLLLKNYHLSDDVAFRFSEHAWAQWPLTASKYVEWLQALPSDQPLVNLFMDYESFGEHQWREDGIFEFLRHFPEDFLQHHGNSFSTISQAIGNIEPAGEIDTPFTITWADAERDLSAWAGNAMQHEALNTLYGLQKSILATKDTALIEDWRRLQTSDHFYYMCTKWFNDGDVHAYFNPYPSPYDAFIFFSNALRDLRLRLTEHNGSSTAK